MSEQPIPLYPRVRERTPDETECRLSFASILAIMLPDEVLLIINDQYPCREAQVRTLAALYNVNYSPPSLSTH